MKPGSIGEPDMCLEVTKLRAVQLENDMTAWGMISSKDVQDAVNYLGQSWRIEPKDHG